MRADVVMGKTSYFEHLLNNNKNNNKGFYEAVINIIFHFGEN
jgi:hypothetical protein